MAVSIIDGTIERVVPGRHHPKISRFKSIAICDEGGMTRTIDNAIASGDVAGEIREGNRARFYTFTTLDLKGIHGVRKPDGAAVFGYPANVNAAVFILLLVANIAWIALRLATEGDVPLLGALLAGLGATALWLTRRGASSARAQFDADAL